MATNDPFDVSSLYLLRRQALVDWWTQLEMGGDCGSTCWEVLDPIRDAVTACLALGPPAIDKAEHLTARALRLITGEDKV